MENKLLVPSIRLTAVVKEGRQLGVLTAVVKEGRERAGVLTAVIKEDSRERVC